jgi:hypothetical protein
MGQFKVLTISGVLLLALAGGCDRNAQPLSEPLDAETLSPDGGDAASGDSLSEPPPPPPEAFLGQLPPAETSQLNNLGVAVMVPGTVPPSFSLATMRTDQQDTSIGYILVYQDAANRCFAIEFASDGIGDPPATQQRLPVQTPGFEGQDYGLNYGPFIDEAMQQQFPGDNLYTDWLTGTDGFYRLVGAAYVGELFTALTGCTDVSPEEAVAIVESLTPLNPTAIGDGEGSRP